MVQSEVEVVKIHSLFQKVLYRWLDCSQYTGFSIDNRTPYLDVRVTNTSFDIVSYHDNQLPRCAMAIVKISSCKYDYWKMGVGDYVLRSTVRFYSRNKLQYDFKRDNINTQDIEWYPYVTEILAPLNESQHFNLEFTLREVLKVLEKELEYRQKQYYSLNTDFEQYKGLEFQEGFKRLD